MSKIVIGLAFDTMQEAQNFLVTLPAGQAPAAQTFNPAPPPATPQPQFTPQPQPQPQPQTFQPQPQPQTFQPQPQTFQPQPQPAPAGQQNHTVQTVLPLMQKYIAMYKAPGAKAAFAKFGLPPTLPQLDQNGLNTMAAFFDAMQPA